jgi:hypothetical protein
MMARMSEMKVLIEEGLRSRQYPISFLPRLAET